MWAVLHEVRSEYAQIMSCIFLLISGPGPWSLDAWLAGEQRQRDDSIAVTAVRPPETGRRPPAAEPGSASDVRRVANR